MVEFIAKLLTFFIPNKKIRKLLRTKIMTFIYGTSVIFKAAKIGKNLSIRGFSRVNNNTYLANNVSFNGMKVIGRGKVSIGQYFHSGEGCMIITENHNYDNAEAIPYDDTYISKEIEIADFVWLGSRVIILPGTKIGEGAIIQAGAVVHGEIPPCAIAGGNPAKVFKYRNKEQFEKLKLEGKFH